MSTAALCVGQRSATSDTKKKTFGPNSYRPKPVRGPNKVVLSCLEKKK